MHMLISLLEYFPQHRTLAQHKAVDCGADVRWFEARTHQRLSSKTSAGPAQAMDCGKYALWFESRTHLRLSSTTNAGLAHGGGLRSRRSLVPVPLASNPCVSGGLQESCQETNASYIDLT